MNYELNSSKSYARVLLFAAAGDGKLSQEELENIIQDNASLEARYESCNSMLDIFKGALDSVFGSPGEEEDEEVEEDNINLEALEESEIKEIGNEVLKNLAKCSTAQEVKDYCTLICSAITDETLKSWVAYNSIVFAGSDSADGLSEKNELRNVKYIHKELEQDFKENQKSYLHSLTWYDDHYLENDEGEVDLKVKEDGNYNETAGLITKLAVAVTYADLDLKISTNTLAGAYFVACCDIARNEGKDIVEICDNDQIIDTIQDGINGVEATFKKGGIETKEVNEAYQKMWELIKNEKDPSSVQEKILKFKSQAAEEIKHLIDSLAADLDTNFLKKTAYKICYLIAKSDDDVGQLVRRSTMDAFTGVLKDMDLSEEEEIALGHLAKAMDLDPDIKEALDHKLENGEFRDIY